MKEYHVYNGDELVGSVYASNISSAKIEARYVFENISWTIVVDPSVSEYD